MFTELWEILILIWKPLDVCPGKVSSTLDVLPNVRSVLPAIISPENTFSERQRAEISWEAHLSMGRRLLKQESHLCMSRAADLKIKLLAFYTVENNTLDWLVEGVEL